MGNALFITGTGTDVGKSALSLSTLLWARGRGLNPVYCKPVQCGTFPFGRPRAPHGDADWIRALAPFPVTTYVIYRFQDPVSPHLAAEREGVAIDMERLRKDLEALMHQADFLVVEGAGGAAVPLDRQGSSLGALAAEIGIPALLACAPGLGTLHHTLATVAWLERAAAPIAGFAFCQREAESPEMAEDNRRTLESLAGLPCFGTVPFVPALGKRGPLSPADAADLASALSPALEAWWTGTRA